jgi:hypothetical protein
MTKTRTPKDGYQSWETDMDLIQAVAGLEEHDPPADFAARVTAALPRRRPGLLVRLRLWAATPRTLTLVPARLAPVALGLVLFAAGVAVTLAVRQGPTGPADGLVPVRFVLQDPGTEVRSVAVIGSFNQWEAGGFQMRYDPAAQAWILEARVPPGSHEYGFLIDGQRIVPDPSADLTRDDGFGNQNSILLVNGHAI